MPSNSRQLAELSFYPFEDTRWAWNEIWDNVYSQAKWLPEKLQWTQNPEALWLAPELAVSQTCGWPLITRLSQRVQVVGSFRHSTPESVSHYYRSVVLGRVDGTPFDFQGSTAAVNGIESLSGWISLIAAIHGPQETWRGDVKISKSHYESALMLSRGEADVASIDSVTFAHLKRVIPEVISSLFIICNGPLVPCLPLITNLTTTSTQLQELRQALSNATRDQNLSRATEALFITGFDALELDDYLSLRSLTPNL